jgi:hypothetical protein
MWQRFSLRPELVFEVAVGRPVDTEKLAGRLWPRRRLSSINHPIRAGQHAFGNGDADRPRRALIHDQIEAGRLLNRYSGTRPDGARACRPAAPSALILLKDGRAGGSNLPYRLRVPRAHIRAPLASRLDIERA